MSKSATSTGLGVPHETPSTPLDISNLSVTELQQLVHRLHPRLQYLEAQEEKWRQDRLEFDGFRSKYLDLYDSAPVGYLTVSKGCRILESNITAARLLGVERNQLIGRSLHEFVSDEDADLFFHHLMSVFITEDVTTSEIKLRKSYGDQVLVEFRSIVEHGANNRHDRFKIVLSNITERRQSEILQRKLSDNLESLWHLSTIQTGNLKLLADHVLEEIKRITESKYAFYGFINDEETEMEIYSWSKEAMNQCGIDDKPRTFRIAEAGLWADVMRKRQPVVINDYDLDHEGKLGIPQGHVSLKRFVSVPVFSKGRIVAVGAVANKESEYVDSDVQQLEAFLGHAQIIAEQTKLQEALQKSELKFRTVADFTHDWEYWIQPDGVLVYVSPSCHQITGYSPEEFIGNPELLLEIVHTDDLSIVRKSLLSIGSGPPLHYEFRIVSRAGDTRFIGQVSQAVYSEGGVWLGRRVSNRDITRRKLLESHLETSEEKFSKAFLLSQDSISITRLEDGIFVSVNEGFKRILGFTEEEVIGKTASELHIWEEPEVTSKFLESVRDEGENNDFDARFRTKNGDIRHGLISPSIIDVNGEKHVLTILKDITSRKLMEETLRERERAWNTLINNLPGFVYRCDNHPSWTMHYISDGCQVVTGYAPNDFIGNKNLSFRNVVCPDYRRPLWAKWQEAIRHKSVFEDEYPIIAKGGENRWVWERGRAVFSDDDQLLFLEGFVTDITERKRVQAELLENQKNFEGFFESIDDIVVIASRDGKIMHANSTLTRKLGYTPEELRTMNVLDLNSKSERQAAETIFSEMFSGHRNACPIALEKKDGTLVPSETRVWLGKWSAIDAVFGISKDLTMEKDALQRFDRLFQFNPIPLAVNSVPDGKFVAVNDGFLSTLGFSREEIIDKTIDDLDIFPEPEAQREAANRIEVDGGIKNFPLRVKKKSGNIVDGLFYGTIIVNQGRKYFLTAMLEV